MTISWQFTGHLNPQELVESRLQLHYAVQLIAAASALAEPLPDDSHSSLAWDADLGYFMGRQLQARQPFQIALDPVSLTLQLLATPRQLIAHLPLDGQTLATGLDWLKHEISGLGADVNTIRFFDYPPDDFPDHPLAQGATFDSRQPATREELARYYANTQQLLQAIAAPLGTASEPRIWPHHFDIALLITLPGTPRGTLPSIGVGLSPGDRSYLEPYWYVSPYPYPDLAELPELDGPGFWHTQHWVGRVLPAACLSETAGTGQQQQVQAYLDTAIAACTTLFQ